MAMKGQKFSLDLDADNFQFDIQDGEPRPVLETFSVVREVKEREPTQPPPPPKQKSKSGFPEHRARKINSRFKEQQRVEEKDARNPSPSLKYAGPSDHAIAHHIGQKYGFDTEAKEKAQISEENKKKLATMSTEEIEQARNELMSGLNPALIQRLLSRANIEEDQTDQHWDYEETTKQKQDSKRSSIKSSFDERPHESSKKVKFADDDVDLPTRQQHDEAGDGRAESREQKGLKGATRTSDSDPSSTQIKESFTDEKLNADTSAEEGGTNSTSSGELTSIEQNMSVSMQQAGTSTHFPVPPRDAAAFPELDPNSATFLEDLRSHYFPDTPHDPNSLTWLQDPTDEEKSTSAYAPTQHAYAPSDIRFDFAGRLIPPSESDNIPSNQGLHHHGEAPNSAGYTIPELAMLCRSSLPNQRCIAYQTLGRILYRLGRGDFGPKGTELHEGLWSCIEHERPLEVIMAEANRTGGHISAKTYATEALWLWRRGGGGDRGILKQGQRVVR